MQIMKCCKKHCLTIFGRSYKHEKIFWTAFEKFICTQYNLENYSDNNRCRSCYFVKVEIAKMGKKNSNIVCKFGGTSCANAQNILKVEEIISSNKNRKFIVVSAPGKRSTTDIKITDMLYTCHNALMTTGNCDAIFGQIAERFLAIAHDLQIDNIQLILEETRQDIYRHKSLDFTASRGEYLNAICIAKRLNLPFIDAKDIIFFNEQNTLDENRTYTAIATKLKGLQGAIIPGFYGTDVKGNIKTFSRGGSDISGAILARGVDASIYENWTDVDAFLVCDPNIVENPQKISMLSFQELRELSYMGANVLHADCIFPLIDTNIVINIRNTFNPNCSGTDIVQVKDTQKTKNVITGIAGKKDFTILHIEKAMMNTEVGFVHKVLSLIKEENISFEHMPSGIDMISLVIESKLLQGERKVRLLEKIEREVRPDCLKVIENIALIAIVGHGMQGTIGSASRVLQAISKANINIRIIDKSSGELNIIVGVNNADYAKSIQALYAEFFD